MAGRSSRGTTMREMRTAPSAMHTACTRKGHAVPAANSTAPTAGPTRLFMVSEPAEMRALPMPRSAFDTTIGSRVPVVVSANTSAVPSRNIVTRTTATFTEPVTSIAVRTARTPARTRSTATTSRRRSTRSASTPAYSPNSSQGRNWSSPLIATRNGSEVWDAISSGPAARAMPSPRLLVQDDPTSQRKDVPIRAGSTASTTRPTRRARYETHLAPCEDIPGRVTSSRTGISMLTSPARSGTRMASGAIGPSSSSTS